MLTAKQAREVGWRPSSRDNGTIVRVFCFQGGVGYFMPPSILRGLFLKAGRHAWRNRAGRFEFDAGAARPRGVDILTFANHKDGDRRRKPDAKDAGEASAKASPPKKRAAVPEVGDALRSAYQRTINEDIPPEMLDLLGKLG